MDKHCKWYNDEFCTNADSPCVADYCPVVEYPELCKHREIDKDINVRSKTELTDEEIVKALECKVGGCMICESVNAGCPYDMKSYCDHEKHLKDILDLIHRLQGENSERQKKVDELKSENTELYKEHTTLIAGSILEKQDIAKYTAKEILTELKPIIINYLEEYMENGSEEAPKYFERLCKKYGVEV